MDFSQEDAYELDVVSTSKQVTGTIIINDEVESCPLRQRQRELEADMRYDAQAKFVADQERLSRQGQMTASTVGSKFKAEYLDLIVREMKTSYRYLKGASDDPMSEQVRDDALLAVIEKTITKLDFIILANIGFCEIINSLDFGSEEGKTTTILRKRIGEYVEFSVFINYIDSIDADLLQVIKRLHLRDPITRKPKKLKLVVEYANSFSHIEWEGWSEEDKKRISDWIVACTVNAQKNNPIFEIQQEIAWAKGDELAVRKNAKTKETVILTEYGRYHLHEFVEHAASNVGANKPMIIPPDPWDLSGVGGGYLEVHPGERSKLIHNNEGSQPSQMVVDTLNNLQNVGWELNPFIYDVLHRLKEKNVEIGSFKMFHKELYEQINPLILFQDLSKDAWVEAKEKATNGDDAQLRKMKSEYSQKCQQRDEIITNTQKAVLAKRVLQESEHWVGKKFWLPWFFDRRFRAYCLVDTMNPQGTDFQKALLQFQEGLPVTNDSYEELLISIATTYGHGLDKKAYHDRIEGAKLLVPMFKKIVANPLSTQAKDIWTEADEPFQFLALVEEYHAIYIENDPTKRRYEHKVSSGRDATCSGIQIAGALLRDAKTCFLVNVIPSDKVQDAYGAIAEEAHKLLRNEKWMANQLASRLERQEAISKKQEKVQKARSDQGLPPLALTKRTFKDTIDIPIDAVDRSVAKMVVMLTPYGGSFQTMLGHVRDKMEAKGYELHTDDNTTLSHALVEGMNNALPGFAALNAWFKKVAARVIANHGNEDTPQIVWITPSGVKARQCYIEEEVTVTRSYTHGDIRKPRYIQTTEHGDGKRDRKTKERAKRLISSKMRTALAANVVHSLDAAILHLALKGFTSGPFTANHDCVYAPSGGLKRLTDAVKVAFKEVVGGEFLMDFLSFNDLEDDDELVSLLRTMTYSNDDIIDGITQSQYLFC